MSIHKLFAKYRSKLRRKKLEFQNARSQKIFCIGRNKTGTKSISVLFESLGYRVAPQSPGELLLKDWIENRFDRIIRFARTSGQVFQDVPFSLSETYKHLDQAFPGSKFILTVRDSPEIWCDSQLRSHRMRFGRDGALPTKADLISSEYAYPGYIWDIMQSVYQTPPTDLYNEEILMNHYLKHNEDVRQYFSSRPDDLLVLNLAAEDAAHRLSVFLEIPCTIEKIPWENKTVL